MSSRKLDRTLTGSSAAAAAQPYHPQPCQSTQQVAAVPSSQQVTPAGGAQVGDVRRKGNKRSSAFSVEFSSWEEGCISISINEESKAENGSPMFRPPGLLRDRYEDRCIFVLDQKHQEFRRLFIAGVLSHQVNSRRILIECLTRMECYFSAAIHLHDYCSFEHVHKSVCVVAGAMQPEAGI